MELTLEQALQKGIEAHKAGKVQEADRYYTAILKANPKHPDANHNMGVLAVGVGKVQEALPFFKTALEANAGIAQYWLSYINALIKLNRTDDAKAVLEQAKSTGAKGDGFDQLEKQLGASPTKGSDAQEPPNDEFQKLVNQYNQGQYQEALEKGSQLLEKFPNSINLYNITGAANQSLGKLDEAIDAYNKAIAIKPDYADAYYNMGNALKEQGKLEEAIEAYNKALAIKPDYADALVNLQRLVVQLLPISANYDCDFDTIEAKLNSEILLRPMYQIQNAIKNYLQADLSKVRSYINNFKAFDQKLLAKLAPKDKVFCNAYSIFIEKLVDANWDDVPASENKVYHLGESHCLSYAHRNIRIGASSFRIAPRIIFGAKAFHFSRKKQDAFKAITKAHLVSLPKNSKVFLSYGEIDCRPNEGFISAARKLNKPLEELIDKTTEGYVQWFLDQNEGQRHHLYFVNVPAPVYNKEHSAYLNV